MSFIRSNPRFHVAWGAVGTISRSHSRVPQRTKSATASSARLTPETRLHSAASGELVRLKPFQSFVKGFNEFWLYTTERRL